MLIAFDFDGVLADSQLVARRFLAGLAAKRGRPPPDWASLSQQTTAQTMRQWRIMPWSVPGILRAAKAQMVAERHSLLPVAAGLQVIRWAHAHKLAVAIVSSNAQQAIDHFVAAHMGDIGFVAVLGDAPLFAKHRILARLLRGLRCPPAAAVYVGDEARDMTTARRLNVRGIGVSWGKESAALLRTAGAWQVADDGPALIALLHQLLPSLPSAAPKLAPAPAAGAHRGPGHAPRR